MNDHSDCTHPTTCRCGNPVTGEAHFPDRAQTVEELMIFLSGGIIVSVYYVCDSCVEFAIDVTETIASIDELV